jgi:hypothetical protein
VKESRAPINHDLAESSNFRNFSFERLIGQKKNLKSPKLLKKSAHSSVDNYPPIVWRFYWRSLHTMASRPSMSRISSTAPAISTMPVQPHNKEASYRRRARAASNTSKPLDSIVETTQRHSWVIPGVISALIFALWLAFDRLDTGNPFTPFVMMSYRVVKPDGEICYGKGKKDFLFCAFYTAVFTFLRELTMEMVLRPLARKTGLNKTKQDRFMEQSYSCLHYTVFGLFGLVPHPH